MAVVGGTRPVRGRRNELGVIASAITRAVAGQPSTIALVGEPGIGKTRLAHEAEARASAAGFTTLWGRAWEAGGAPAYWPWRQLCDGLPRETIAQLWGGRGAAADPDQARFELFDSVTRAVATAAQSAPVLCIFDDLHVADIPSLELVAFATRHLRTSRVVWLATWRDAEGARAPVRDQLVKIAREATVLPLSALTEIDANELIDDVRADADVQLRGKLVRTTGGNPLFLLETLAALATGHAVRDVERLPLAQGIAAIVRDRLAPLSADVRRLAEIASVIGRDVVLDRWLGIADRTADVLRRSACELVDAGILTTIGPDRWRFGHELVRDAIYRAANEHEIVEHHRRLAHLLDREIAMGATALVGERAHHALHLEDTRTIVDWTVAAADHARCQCAYEESLAIVDRAIARIGPPAQRDAALNLERGRALIASGDNARATEAFNTAIALARTADDPKLVAAAVLGLGSRYVFGDHLHDLIVLIDEAMAGLPEAERELHGRLLARKAAALTPAADPDPVLDMARSAHRLVETSSDAAARLEVAVAVGAALQDFAHPRERTVVNEEVVSLARAVGDRALELRGLSRLVSDHIESGDFARADAVLGTRDALARALVQPRFAWMEPLFRSMRGMRRGDWDICDTAVAEAATYAHVDPNCARACAVHRTLLLLYADRVGELRAHEPAMLDALRTMTPIISSVLRATIRLRAGELADARRELDALEPDLAHGRASILLATLAEVAAEVGPTELQRKLYDLLAPRADSFAVFGPFALTCGPPMAATLGQLAGAMGDLDRARAHFDSSLVMATAAGARVGRAWTLYWYGRALARAGDPEAVRRLDEAATEATRLDMPRLVTRCRDVAGPAPATAARAEPARPSAAIAWTMIEHAGTWLVSVGDRSFLVPNLRGMPLLARLAASPHVEVHSLELVSGPDHHEVSGDAGELLDDKARAAYRKRIATLADQLDDAQARGDVARAEEIRDEHEALVQELSRAVGRHGKVRRAGASGERARVAAHRRLREAIKKISELDGELGGHLDTAIRTGTFCAYRP